jgi:hypothetical protein
MKYDDLFIVDKNKIEKIIQEAKLEIDSTIIMTVNKIITKEFTLPISSNDDNIADIIDTQCCLPFLSCFYHNKPAVHIDASFAELPQQNTSSVDFTYRRSVTSTYDRGLYVTKGAVKPTDSSMNDTHSNKLLHKQACSGVRRFSSESKAFSVKHSKTNHVVRKIDEEHTVMLNLILFLQSLCTEDLIMIAKYHNLYFKNFIFQKVLLKEKLVLEQHLTLINWVYDHICIYLYNQNYKF